MSDRTFMELVLAGEILEPEREIEELVARWHRAAPAETRSLHEFLGMTWDEYSLWAERPAFLRAIFMARHQGIPLSDIVRSAEPAAALAARGVPAKDIDDVRRWLQQTGRL